MHQEQVRVMKPGTYQQKALEMKDRGAVRKEGEVNSELKGDDFI